MHKTLLPAEIPILNKAIKFIDFKNKEPFKKSLEKSQTKKPINNNVK